MEHRVLAGERVVARVVAERPLLPALARGHPALQHDLGLRRHLEVARHAARELDAPAAEPAGEDDLVHAGRERRGGRVDQRRIGAERDRHGHPRAGARRLERHALVLGAALVGLPVHAERHVVEDLQPVHADVARPGARVAREHRGQRDVAAPVAGPAAEDRQARERRINPPAQTIRIVTPHRTALIRLAAPTPEMLPVMTCVVLTGMPR